MPGANNSAYIHFLANGGYVDYGRSYISGASPASSWEQAYAHSQQAFSPQWRYYDVVLARMKEAGRSFTASYDVSSLPLDMIPDPNLREAERQRRASGRGGEASPSDSTATPDTRSAWERLRDWANRSADEAMQQATGIRPPDPSRSARIGPFSVENATIVKGVIVVIALLMLALGLFSIIAPRANQGMDLLMKYKKLGAE